MVTMGSMWRSKSVLYLHTMVILIVMAMAFECSSAELHLVGGSKVSWNPIVNLTNWSSLQKFYLGDWLYFGYANRYQYNVLEVNETSYENCIDKDFIHNFTRGAGRDVVELTEAKIYYFLSGSGYCFQGLKVAVLVEEIPPAPAPAPRANDSPAPLSLSQLTGFFVLMLISIAVWL